MLTKMNMKEGMKERFRNIMKKVTKKRVGRTSQGRKGRISRSNNGGNSIVNVPSNKNIIFIVTLIILLLSIVNMFMMITITGAQITETSTVGLCVNNPPTITAIPNQTNAQGA